MQIEVHETNTKYVVHIKDKFREKKMSYEIKFFGKEGAKTKAYTLAQKLKFFPDLSWDDVEQFLAPEVREAEVKYNEQGHGITISSGNKCYSVYYKYFEGRSPYFRILFSKLQFGEKRAYNLAKRFHKDYLKLKKTQYPTDADMEKLIEKYEKIKMQQELINIEAERRKKLQEYREKKK